MSIKKQQPIAAFTKRGKEEVLYLSFLSSSSETMYLLGVAIVKGVVVIAHECPATRAKKPCWHTRVALESFKEWLGRKNVPTQVFYLNKKIDLDTEMFQIPIPTKTISIERRERYVAS